MEPSINSTPYNISLIPTDLRQEEAMHQICDALDYLNNVANDVFQRLGARITENHSRLATINARIDRAQSSVEKVRGINKATKIFSSAKFPSPDEEKPYETIYTGDNDLQTTKRAGAKIKEQHAVVDQHLLKKKLQSFAIQLHLDCGKRRDDSYGEGLGGLPQDVQSVSSLLLFNTTENPYKKYVLLDPLGAKTKIRAGEQDEEGLAEAPSTILQREELDRQVADSYSYMPGLGEVPEIAVPDFLPDLHGVAGDLSYSADLGPSIAPSVPTANLPDLPTFGQEEELPSDLLSNKAPVVLDPGLPQTAPGPAPPPPPPPPSAAPPAPPPPPPPPAPPPPPPPMAPEAPSAPPAPSGASTESTPKVAKVDISDGRAGLLDAIRNAGGAGKANLKKANKRKLEAKKKKKEEKQAVSSGGGGDLMGDLTAKLQMRRKGISGTGKPKDGDENRGGNRGSTSAMDRISCMIPPPRNTGKSEEEDWK